MSISFSGFDDLINDLNNLGNIGNKIGKKAVEEGAKIVLEQMREDSPKDSGNDEHGADKLKVTQIKNYTKSGTCVGRVGIDSTNWEDTKGLIYSPFKTPLIRWNSFIRTIPSQA